MADQPNVLVLLTDQQRADTLERDACRTPNLDRLADRGPTATRSRGMVRIGGRP